MKKTILITAMSLLIFACGKDGELGPIGPKGIDGATGAKGVTGDKGAIGAPGAVGDAGKNATTEIYFTDWIPASVFVKGTETATSVNYVSNNVFITKFIPNYKTVSLKVFESLEELSVYNTSTKVLLGSLYKYNSLLDNNGKRIIFKDNFDDNTKSFSSFYIGLFSLEGLDIVPSVDDDNTITFTKSAFPANTNFSTISKNLDVKNRYIYIPVGLPQKSGRVKKIETYQELLVAYNIPEIGSSK